MKRALLITLGAAWALSCGSSEEPGPGAPGGGSGGIDPAGAGGGVYQDNLVQQARMNGPTFVEILEVRARDDGFLFFCSAVRGLNIVDAREPGVVDPYWQVSSSLGSSAYPRCQHLAYAGDALYISNRGDEIQPTAFITAFDATNMVDERPEESASYVQDGLAFEGLAAVDDLVFAAVHEAGVLVLRNEGDALVPIGQLGGLVNAWGLALWDDRLYVADGPGGLAIADVSDPSAPELLGAVVTEGSAQFVELDPDRELAFVAAGSAGMVVVDVSEPAAPSVLSRSETPGTTLQVSLSGDHAFVADWNDVRVFDVADPAAPQLVAVERIDVMGYPRVLGAAALPIEGGDAVFMGEWTGLYRYAFTPGITAPDMRLRRDFVDLGPAEPGELKAASIIFDNEGQEPLVIDQFFSEAPSMTLATELPVTIAPGEAQALEVRVENPGTDQHAGTVRFGSDDPDEEVASIILRTNTTGLGVGDPAPDVEINLVGGGTWTLEEQLGNVVVLSYFATF